MTTCLNSPDTIDNHTYEPMSYSEAILYPDLSELAVSRLSQTAMLVPNSIGHIEEADSQSQVKNNYLCARRSWGGYPSPVTFSHQVSSSITDVLCHTVILFDEEYAD